MTGLVSVIIPCYNHGRYLPDALDSVLAQTHTDWEAIVVDDGSTDDTQSVAQGYVERDTRVQYVYQPNAGLSAARNAGIGVARGDYLAFLDADDSWEPAFLEATLSAIKAQPDLAGVYCGTMFVDEKGEPLRRGGNQTLDGAGTRARLLRGGFFPVHAVLVRARAVGEVKLFDTALTSLEDWDLWLRITAQGDLAGVPERLARYRLVAGSMSTDVERMHRNRIAVLAKQFGPPEGPPPDWLQEKREAYAWAYQAAAVQYITQGQPDEGWQNLARAAAIWPAILLQPETHYELACWDQPRGYRGQAETLDLERNVPLVLAGLEQLFVEGGEDLQHVRSGAFGQAYLAFAMLADQAGRWGLARGYLLRAVGHDPRLLAQPGVVRRLAKLMAGQRLVAALRSGRAACVPGQEGG